MTLATKPTLSAKDFRNPLLKVLGQMTQHQAQVLVDNDSTYEPVLTVMGITQDQYGFEQATGSPWTQRWTQWAFQWLKEKNLGTTSGRGKWGLTPAGVAQALALNGGQATVVVAQAAAAPVAAPTPTSNHLLEGTYHPDPYIQQVALADHKCYGFYSAQSPVCPDCPARVLCQEKRVDRIREIVAMFAKDDAGTPVPSTPIQIRPTTLGGKIPATATVTHIPNQTRVLCRGCQVHIEINEEASWVRGLGDNGKGSAMYHKKCYEDAKG